MKRLTNWRARLTAAMTYDPKAPFAWGSNDCFLGLAVPAIEAVTGQDLGAAFRGKYSDFEGAKAALAAAGFADLAAAAANYFPEIPVARAHIGDIVTLESGSEAFGVALGVVIGERIMVLTPRGHATVKMTSASRAFRVG
jgi:hypothetical protein